MYKLLSIFMNQYPSAIKRYEYALFLVCTYPNAPFMVYVPTFSITYKI